MTIPLSKTDSFSSLNTKNIIRHESQSVEGVSIIHPKSAKCQTGYLQDSRGLATASPYRHLLIHPKSAKYQTGYLQDSRGLATASPYRRLLIHPKSTKYQTGYLQDSRGLAC